MGIETRDEYAYTGLHVYAFVQGVLPDPEHPEQNAVAGFVERLGEISPEGPVTAAVEVAGTFQLLVHLRFPDDTDAGPLHGLQGFLAEPVWNGVTYNLVYEGPAYTGPLNELIGIKKHSSDIVAIVKVWVERGRSREVLGRLGDELGDRFHGASIVYGDCDIILALEGPTLKSVAGAALGMLQEVDGVVRTETSFTDWRRVPGGERERGAGLTAIIRGSREAARLSERRSGSPSVRSSRRLAEQHPPPPRSASIPPRSRPAR